MRNGSRAAGTWSEDALYGAIPHRKSVRRFLDKPVPKEILARLLEMARWAPSAHNRQPWRFLVLGDDETRSRLAKEMGKRLTADRRVDGDSESEIERDVARSRDRIAKAPVLILVCMTMQDMDRYDDEKRAAAERLMVIQSTAMSVQNLFLAAHAEGLASCWMCAPIFCVETVRRVLVLPMQWEPQALVVLGFPANPGKERTRLPLTEIVSGWESLP